MKKRILVIVEANVSTDSRVQRQLGFLLNGGYEIDCASLEPGPEKDVTFVCTGSKVKQNKLKKLFGAFFLLFKAYKAYYWQKGFIRKTFDACRNREYDAILANDIDMLPLALSLAKGKATKVVVDAHEFSPGQFSNRFLWRILISGYLDWICREYLRKADAMMTVSSRIAELYRERYGVKPEIVTNAPAYEDLKPSAVDSSDIRLIHHGKVNPSRKLELMIHMMEYLPENYSLTFMIVNKNGSYVKELMKHRSDRVRFIDSVSPEQVAKKVNEYDIGVYLLPPDNVNQKNALPNKFFEFIQGRLAIAIGPSPEMADYVRKYELGAVADDFEPASLAQAIQSMTPEQIMRVKENSNRIAGKECAKTNQEVVLKLLEDTL